MVTEIIARREPSKEFSFWRKNRAGHEITVIDHQTQRPMTFTKREVYAAQYGANNLARRVGLILQED